MSMTGMASDIEALIAGLSRGNWKNTSGPMPLPSLPHSRTGRSWPVVLPPPRFICCRSVWIYRCFDVAHGPQNQRRLSWYFSQADALVLPSIEEGLAFVQAQAMACGVPVIATTNTGAEDLFTDGVEGFIVPIRDVAALRERIEILLDDDSRRKTMAEAALRRVQTLGGWNEYGERALELDEDMAMGTRRDAR